MDTLYQLEDEHGRLHYGRHGYLEIERFDEAIGSGFAPMWVNEAIKYPTPVLMDFEFDTFSIPCEDCEVNASEPLEVACDGIIGFGRATFEIGLPTVYQLWYIWNQRVNGILYRPEE